MESRLFHCNKYNCNLTVQACNARRKAFVYTKEKQTTSMRVCAMREGNSKTKIPRYDYCATQCTTFPRTGGKSKRWATKPKVCACGCGLNLPIHTSWNYATAKCAIDAIVAVREALPRRSWCNRCHTELSPTGLCMHCSQRNKKIRGDA
jgi:hypothetical protein